MNWYNAVPRPVQGVLAALTLPAALAHELTHAVVAAPFASETVLVEPVSPAPHCAVTWRESTPRWAIALAAFAPLLVGITVAVAGIVWALTAGSVAVPETARQWLIAGVGAIWYAIYVTPSPGDAQAARGDA